METVRKTFEAITQLAKIVPLLDLCLVVAVLCQSAMFAAACVTKSNPTT